MATIKTAIQMYNGMTPGLRSMNNAMNMVISSFETMQRLSSSAVDTHSLAAARAELNKAEMAFNQIEQEILQADQAQNRLNNDIRNGQVAAAGLLEKVKNLAVGLGATLGLKQIIETSDTMASINARLNLINDKQQTTAQLNDMIFQSAQRARSSYVDTAATVSKLGILAGHAFSSNKEMITFAELMNKNFKIGGASIQEQISGMYQLTQAMAAGKLQGDEFRSIMENAPLLAQAIAEYTGKSIGELKELSAEGSITADIIKNAMFKAADETNKRFAELPMTWGEVWTMAVNNIIKYSQPLLNFINVLANNWDILTPIIWGTVGALIAYNAVMGIGWFTTLKAAAATAWKTACSWAETAALIALTAAQEGLNAALYACPLTWIITGIIVLIALFYAAVAAVNKFAGTSYSATGMVAGAFMVALTFIANLFRATGNFIMGIVAMLWNAFAAFVEFLANVFIDPVGSIVRLFANMADTVLSFIEAIARGLDTITGWDNASKVHSIRGSLQGAVNNLVGEARFKIPRMDPTGHYLDRLSYSEAWKKGMSWGTNLENRFKANNDIADLLNGIYNAAADTAGNTGKMADSMEIAEEDLKYLRDLAEREVIDRTVLRDIHIDISNAFGDIRETADIDGIKAAITQELAEALASEAEGSFYDV